MTAFLYLMTVRDYIFEHLNHLTGARLTYSYVRIGGLARDLPEGWLTRLEEILVFSGEISRAHPRAAGPQPHLHRSHARRRGDDARACAQLGLHRPDAALHRARVDLRKDAPYLAYPELDFEVPVGIKGDNYDRYYVRMCEIDESIAMVRQCVRMLRDGPVSVDDPRVTLPAKELVYTRDRGARASLQARQRGIVVPPGEIYVSHEAPNGELGFYLVSDGTSRPYKLHVRSPSFVHMGGMHTLLEGYQVADVVPTFGSMNMVGGECDR